jgi:tetratricopeptide (TPR) repeat protein
MMAAGEFAPAKQNLEIALKTSSEWIGDHDLYAMLVDVAVRRRDESDIRKYAAQAEALATHYGHELYQAIVHRAWGVAYRLGGDNAAAEASLNRALEIFSQLKTRWQMGHTLFELGELAVTQASTAEARDFFTRAIELFEAMQATPDVLRTRAVLEALK